MRYKAIGFDYGGVIHGLPGSVFMQKAAESLGVELEALNKTYFEHNHKLNIKDISIQEVWQDVLGALGRSDHWEQFNIFQANEYVTKIVNPEILELMKTLRMKGYRIGILSNYNRGLREKLDEQGITPLVEAIGISVEMGCMKPQKEAFEKFCEMLAVKPQELIYIDDTEKSLETAKEVGYTPLLFTSYEKLIKDLTTLGVFRSEEGM